MYLRNRFQEYLARVTVCFESAGSQRGISLAEVSGVLVVGGLIIAGALKGTELISISQIRGGIAEVQKIQSATSTFIEQYQKLPGDFSAANATLGDPICIEWAGCDGTTDANCDGDGTIEGDGVTGETVLFWQHLTAAKLMTGIELDPAPAATGKVIYGISLPSNPVGGGLTVLNDALNGVLTHWLRLGTAIADSDGVLNADKAKVIDKKIDDGRPATGTVQTVDTECITADGPTGVYQQVATDPTAIACLLNFDLGG
jgi:hypothetical protein